MGCNGCFLKNLTGMIISLDRSDPYPECKDCDILANRSCESRLHLLMSEFHAVQRCAKQLCFRMFSVVNT